MEFLLRFAPVSGFLGTETCDGVVVVGQGSSSQAANTNRLYVMVKVMQILAYPGISWLCNVDMLLVRGWMESPLILLASGMSPHCCFALRRWQQQ